eukprot:TRINITY_DN10269_c0_g1_i1.p1 TRINITY_DN10269_c0_g1~~TRINITY_DN10269_c0_g1_i1.p1  ORF type:complete len:316 (-),score=124.11 TRINITY_DN10269_c0_g1_i1:40-987(-)
MEKNKEIMKMRVTFKRAFDEKSNMCTEMLRSNTRLQKAVNDSTKMINKLLDEKNEYLDISKDHNNIKAQNEILQNMLREKMAPKRIPLKEIYRATGKENEDPNLAYDGDVDSYTHDGEEQFEIYHDQSYMGYNMEPNHYLNGLNSIEEDDEDDKAERIVVNEKKMYNNLHQKKKDIHHMHNQELYNREMMENPVDFKSPEEKSHKKKNKKKNSLSNKTKKPLQQQSPKKTTIKPSLYHCFPPSSINNPSISQHSPSNNIVSPKKTGIFANPFTANNPSTPIPKYQYNEPFQYKRHSPIDNMGSPLKRMKEKRSIF